MPKPLQPRRGAVTFGHLAGRLDLLRVACSKCDRRGQYRVARLIEQHGPGATLPDWKDQMTADCPRRGRPISYLVKAGARGRSFSVRDLQGLHLEMCVQLGWGWRKWAAIGRELKLLGLPTATVTVDGERLTYYEIRPVAEPAANVVPMARRGA